MIHEPRFCLAFPAGNRGDRDQEHRNAECFLWPGESLLRCSADQHPQRQQGSDGNVLLFH